jgi:hypothetical protein
MANKKMVEAWIRQNLLEHRCIGKAHTDDEENSWVIPADDEDIEKLVTVISDGVVFSDANKPVVMLVFKSGKEV